MFLLVILPLTIAWIVPQDTYTLSTGYTVTIQGTSNLHSWNESVETVSGIGMISWNGDGSFNLDAMSIMMDVHSIKSSEGAIMNNNTYKALKADADPEITLKLNVPVKSIQSESGEIAIPTKASLTIAGVTRTVDIQVKVSLHGQQILTFEGSQTINMTDYGIDPPTALFGTLKTGNQITINFKTSFSRKIN